MDFTALRSSTFLRGLTDAEFEAFAKGLTFSEFRRGDKIVVEGTAAHAFYILLAGTLHVRRMAQKREMLLARIQPGSFFGEINLFEPGNATATIYAMEPVTIAFVDYGRFRDFMSANPSIGYKIVAGLMAELSRRLRATNERFVHAMYWSNLNAPAGS